MSNFPSNSQFQTQNAASRFQAAVLVGSPTFPNAIAWSDENLIAVASGHLVTILNPAALPFGPRGLITIQNGKPFSIGVIDREDLFCGCLLPNILSRDHEPRVRSIAWSPVGLAPNSGCLLAVCTTQGFVKLYRQPYRDFCAEWIEVADVSAKLYEYLVSINFDDAPVSPEGSGVNDHEIELEIYSNQLKQKKSDRIVRASKCKVKRVKKTPENSTFPRLTADQYASRSAMLSSLVVSWSPMLRSLPKTYSAPQDGSPISFLAVGGKSGKVSVWRIPVPEYYSVDETKVLNSVALIVIFRAHNSWVTAISWALLDSESSNPQVLLATASSDGSVRIWLAYNEKLLKSSEPNDTSFSLLQEVATVDSVPVTVLSVIVPAKCPHRMDLAVGKGSGSFEVWICNLSIRKFDKIGPYDAHNQTVTGLAWAFDGQSLYSCCQDNVVRCWILSRSSLREVPIPSNTPRLRSSTDLPDGFVSFFGLTVSPGNLVIAWVRNTDVDQLNRMYEARVQKALVEFFWIGGQQLDILPNNSPDFDTEAIPGLSEEFVYWESNFLWSLKQYETRDKPLVVWDIMAAFLAFNHSKPEYVEYILIKWLSISYVGSHVGLSAEEVLLYVSRSLSKVTSRQLHLLNIICRRVMLREMKADEIDSRLQNLEGVPGTEIEKRSLWINLLFNSERELRERLVGFTFSSFLSLVPASSTNSLSGNWFPVGLAQMEDWVEVNRDHVQDELTVLASEVRKKEGRLQSSKFVAAEKCSYCLASVPFESPEVAVCGGKGHKLARCAVSMEVCPTNPAWFCTCCHRRAFKLAPETLFSISGYPLNFKSLITSSVVQVPLKPLCPFCGILLQRLQPDFLLSASPT